MGGGGRGEFGSRQGGVVGWYESKGNKGILGLTGRARDNNEKKMGGRRGPFATGKKHVLG